MKKIIFVLFLFCLCSCNNNKINYVTEPVTIEYTQKYDNEYKPVYDYGTYHVFRYNNYNNTIIEDHYFINPITNDTTYICSDSITDLKISIKDNKVIVYIQKADNPEPFKVDEFTLSK